MDLKRGAWRIVRGGADIEVAKIGMMTTPDIAPLVSASPGALEKANEFHAKHSSGTRLLLVGQSPTLRECFHSTRIYPRPFHSPSRWAEQEHLLSEGVALTMV